MFKLSDRRFRAMLAAVGLCAAFGFAQTARAGDEPTLDGKKLYLKYCSACHGETGKGDGIVSGFMTPHPNDLTKMAKAKGSFPFMAVVQSIEGSATVRAHGDPDMPVWGEILRDPSHEGAQARADVAGRIMLITKYLESIQEK